MEFLLKVEDLRIKFKQGKVEFEAVKGISFAIRPAEIYSLVGETGSGKTVTALALGGLLGKNASVEGRVFYDFNGRFINVLEGSNAQKLRGRQINYIFQDPLSSLDPLMRVGYQIAEGLIWHKKMPKQSAFEYAKQKLREVLIDDVERVFFSFPHQLSGGQAQRVMIAQALALDSELLIADEPTSSLDVTVEMEIMRLLKKLNKQNGLAVLFITHDLTLVEYLGGRAGVLQEGKIVEEFSAGDIFSCRHKPYTRRLIDSCIKL